MGKAVEPQLQKELLGVDEGAKERWIRREMGKRGGEAKQENNLGVGGKEGRLKQGLRLAVEMEWQAAAFYL